MEIRKNWSIWFFSLISYFISIKGIKKLNNNKHRGNHYVVFNLKVPNNLDEKQYNLYRELSKLEE